MYAYKNVLKCVTTRFDFTETTHGTSKSIDTQKKSTLIFFFMGHINFSITVRQKETHLQLIEKVRYTAL